MKSTHYAVTYVHDGKRNSIAVTLHAGTNLAAYIRDFPGIEIVMPCDTRKYAETVAASWQEFNNNANSVPNPA